MIDPDAALAVCRFAHNAAAMLVWGGSAYLWVLVPPHLAQTVGQRLATVQALAVATVIAATVASLPCQTAAVGGGWRDAVAPAVLTSVMFDTGVGRAWQAHGIVVVLLAASLAVKPPTRHKALACASGLLLATLALSGHAAMHEGWLGIAHRANDIVHVLAGGAWLGALLPLAAIVEELGEPAQRAEAVRAMTRFSRAGHGAVALVLLSGVVNTVLVLGRWPVEWSSPYQAMLAAKIALVLLMTGLALVNRYALVPRLHGRPAGATRAILSVTGAEVVLGLSVLALVAVFGLEEPHP